MRVICIDPGDDLGLEKDKIYEVEGEYGPYFIIKGNNIDKKWRGQLRCRFRLCPRQRYFYMLERILKEPIHAEVT